MPTRFIMRMLILLFILISCNDRPSISNSVLIKFHGRQGNDWLYQAEVPQDWKHVAPEKTSLSDTTLPIYTFLIGREDPIRLTIHSFPSTSLDERIAPQAQVLRWQKQLKGISSQEITPIHHGGFGGFRYYAENQHTGVVAYAMQLTPKLYQNTTSQEKRSDYTIKAVGSVEAIQKAFSEIDRFAESFELIEPFNLNL